MAEIKTLGIWIGISIAWPLLCLLVFNKWFFLSPLGLIIALRDTNCRLDLLVEILPRRRSKNCF